MMNLFSLAAERLSQLSSQFAKRLDGQEAAPSFRGDMARDEFFLPHLMGAQERALFLAARNYKDDDDVSHD